MSQKCLWLCVGGLILRLCALFLLFSWLSFGPLISRTHRYSPKSVRAEFLLLLLASHKYIAGKSRREETLGRGSAQMEPQKEEERARWPQGRWHNQIAKFQAHYKSLIGLCLAACSTTVTKWSEYVGLRRS